MNLKAKAIIGAILTALSLGLFRYCDRDRVKVTQPGVLAPGEKERVEIHGKTITVIKREGTVKSYAPGGAKVSIDKDGKVTVTIKRFGLCHEPGLGAAWNGDKLKLALDFKLVYYRRLGLHAGGSFDPTTKKLDGILRPLVFASYTVPFDSFANTSLWVGAELFPQKYACGIRLAF